MRPRRRCGCSWSPAARALQPDSRWEKKSLPIFLAEDDCAAAIRAIGPKSMAMLALPASYDSCGLTPPTGDNPKMNGRAGSLTLIRESPRRRPRIRAGWAMLALLGICG